jgi:cytoplasmic iron level regulating protein YaaA (DUF328/UPF0246 family)
VPGPHANARRLTVLVLLAPSEGKAPPPPDALPVDLGALVYPELTRRRLKLVAALERLVAGRPRRALEALGLGPGQAAELERDHDLLHAPAAPAAEVYTGVLFQHLDLASLAPGASRRAEERILVASALWGVVRLTDRIPAYRLSIGARLPRIGGLAAAWRGPLTSALPRSGLVVDLRSQGYAAAWRPPEGTLVRVRAFSERDGRRTVVSHMAKATRGDVARLLVKARATPRDPEGVAALVGRAGHRVELTGPDRDGSWSVDVIRTA